MASGNISATEFSGKSSLNAILAACAVVLCLLLGWAEIEWPQVFSAPQVKPDLSLPGFGSTGQQVVGSGFVELAKLVVAGMVGLLVASVHRHYHSDRALSRSLLQAEILLCVAGALMMIIIGNSTARALGIAGGASIIRFRTPVEDPRDTIVLFLMLGLGMSVGLGAFAVCGLATLFLCLFLAFLDRFGEERPRFLFLELVATGREFPADHVRDVLRRTVNSFEPVKTAHGNEAIVRYQVRMDQSTPLSYLTNELMQGGAAGLKSVTWEQPRKSEQG
jgi:hypothetical protein